MEILLSWLVSALAIIVTAYVLPGVRIESFLTALVTAVVLGIINSILKPILLFLTLPINILTLGLLTFVINALLVLLASHLVPGFVVDGFWWALAFSIVLSLVNTLLGNLSK
ncbi:MAG TPA: phage holin family protein [Patescibacteria group bacterium]|nr:phage holin family protein [Patescibacteria group bacterium]